MSDIKRVLILDDDNHEYSVVCEDDRYFANMIDFMSEVLSKPHNETYEMRIVHLVNFGTEDMRIGKFVDSMDNWFDLLDCIYYPAKLKEQDADKYLQRSFAFDYFYENGERV